MTVRYQLSILKRLIRASIWLIFNYALIRKELFKYGIKELKPYLLKDWKYKDVCYFTAYKDGAKIFIKYMKNKEIIINEWNAYNQLKNSKKFNDRYFLEYLFCQEVLGGAIIISKLITGDTLDNISILENNKQNFMKQLVEIIDILFDAKIIHRDFRPQNLMITNNEIKLIDFSYAISDLEESLLKETIHEKKILCELNNRHRVEELIWDDAYSLYRILDNWHEKDLLKGINETKLRVGRLKYVSKNS